MQIKFKEEKLVITEEVDNILLEGSLERKEEGIRQEEKNDV